MATAPTLFTTITPETPDAEIGKQLIKAYAEGWTWKGMRNAIRRQTGKSYDDRGIMKLMDKARKAA